MDWIECFETELEIIPSICDASGQLGYPDTFALFMDIAAQHAQRVGLGFRAMAQRELFWLTVKTQLRFLARPRMMESVRLRTWPEAPGRMRGNRSYALFRGNEVLIQGKTEWAVTGTKSHELVPMKQVYPDGVSFDLPPACPGPFAKVPDHFEDGESVGAYCVRSTDIDVGGHMNNAAFVRAMFGFFSVDEMQSMNIASIFVSFRKPCYEGDTLRLDRRKTAEGTDLRFTKNGETALLARIVPKALPGSAL